MSRSPILSVRGLTRTYDTANGGLTVLKGVDLDVMPGEMVGLIGPSGSGKSSLLHAAGLLEKPTEGTVAIDGEMVGDLDERARTRLRLSRIGFVYQFHHLLAEFDARDNVALPMRIAGMSLAQARRQAEETLTTRSLANKPRLLLADEPTGNLDPTTSQSVFESLRDLAKTTGVAALIATHNMELAGHMDRVFALKDGHLEERAAQSQAY